MPKILLSLFALSVALLPALPEDSPVELARAYKKQKQYPEMVEALTPAVKKAGASVEEHELLAFAHAKLDQDDLAAHFYERALDLRIASLEDPSSFAKDKEAQKLTRALKRSDRNGERRLELIEDVSTAAIGAANALMKEDRHEAALGLLGGDFGSAEQRAVIEELRYEIEKPRLPYDLDRTQGESLEPEPGKTLSLTMKHYQIRAHIDEAAARRMGDALDFIYEHYVDFFLQGEDTMKRHARAHIYPKKSEMLKASGRDDLSSGLEGWWSGVGGHGQIFTYDSRSNHGTLRPLLGTFFHEIAHQFMSALEERESRGAPAWINEGTASYFEGASLMADGRVVGPDPAQGRLRNLVAGFKSKSGPRVDEVVGFDEPGSYPAEAYATGWGLVYYMMEYEDPKTLERPYRALHREYLDAVASTTHDPLVLFQKTFIGRKSPRGHKNLDHFARDWRQWILDLHEMYTKTPEVLATHRLQAAERYLKAANEATGTRKTDLLERALFHLNHVRTRIDRGRNGVPDRILDEAKVREQLGMKSDAVPLYRLWLDLCERGRVIPEEEEHTAIKKLVEAWDKESEVIVASHLGELEKEAREILEKYETKTMPVRAYTFARELSSVFPAFKAATERNETAAKEAGLGGGGRTVPLIPDEWGFVPKKPNVLENEADSVFVNTMRTVALINTEVDLSGDYKVRARIEREGNVFEEQTVGLVIGGSRVRGWVAVGAELDKKVDGVAPTAHVGVVDLSDSTGKVTARTPHEPSRKIGEREAFDLSVSVLENGSKLLIEVEGRDPIEHDLSPPLGATNHVGVFVEKGKVRVSDARVEFL